MLFLLTASTGSRGQRKTNFQPIGNISSLRLAQDRDFGIVFILVFIWYFRDLEAPTEWGESGACLIANPEHVKLRAFSTNIHK